ncbi:MAG: sodium-dependent transporter [Bdellovibrionales bacterium]|nr:sodium-dependent transporter [Bdellovibrionales bacterium]
MNEVKKSRSGSAKGFYLAAIGSAFGLGNLWRFPYIVAENGGGAFVLMYLALVFVVGMPFLIGELILGKNTGSAVLPALVRLGAGDPLIRVDVNDRRGTMIMAGFLAITISVLVLAYYTVISGWVLYYLLQFSVGSLSKSGLNPQNALSSLMDNGWLQVLLTFVHFLIVMCVAVKDVEEGVERRVGQAMPIFMILLIILSIKSLSTEGATQALQFFLYPDFSRLSWSSLGRAIGHVCFTLSIGFGTMVSLGSYMGQKVSASSAGFRIAIFDSFASLFAGIMIFPLVFSSSDQFSGPALLFQTIPFLFAKTSNGTTYGITFFLCLYLAALGSSIGILETALANICEFLKMERKKAVIITIAICFVISIIPALSTNALNSITIGGHSTLEAWDGFVVNWLLTLSALIISIVVVRRIDQAVLKADFEDNAKKNSPAMAKIFVHWWFAIRFLAPALCLLGLALQLI